jgi:DNA replication and repair protein RecF
LIALKAAEFAYLKERRTETPMMLLDDVFGELDDIRTQRLLRFLDTAGQTFITTAKGELFDIVGGENCRRFTVAQGTLVYEKV